MKNNSLDIAEIKQKLDFFLKLANTDQKILLQAMLKFGSDYLKEQHERKTRKGKQSNSKKGRQGNNI